MKRSNMKIWLIITICLISCRTVKTTTKVREELKKDVKLNTVEVKAAQKETNTVMYWPDGSVYQVQNVKEQADQTKLERMDFKEQQLVKQSEVLKESKPLNIWVYVGISAVAIAAALVYWKFKN